MATVVRDLTLDDQRLLVDVLFSQEYALELIESELHDIELGNKKVEHSTYQKLVQLYDKLRSEL